MNHKTISRSYLIHQNSTRRTYSNFAIKKNVYYVENCTKVVHRRSASSCSFIHVPVLVIIHELKKGIDFKVILESHKYEFRNIRKRLVISILFCCQSYICSNRYFPKPSFSFILLFDFIESSPFLSSSSLHSISFLFYNLLRFNMFHIGSLSYFRINKLLKEKAVSLT